MSCFVLFAKKYSRTGSLRIGYYSIFEVFAQITEFWHVVCKEKVDKVHVLGYCTASKTVRR